MRKTKTPKIFSSMRSASLVGVAKTPWWKSGVPPTYRRLGHGRFVMVPVSIQIHRFAHLRCVVWVSVISCRTFLSSFGTTNAAHRRSQMKRNTGYSGSVLGSPAGQNLFFPNECRDAPRVARATTTTQTYHLRLGIAGVRGSTVVIRLQPCIQQVHLPLPSDACYDDRGSTFRLQIFLNDGAPQTKTVGIRPFLLHNSRCVPRSWDFLSGSSFIFRFFGEILSSQIEEP